MQRMLVTGGAGFIGSNFVHDTVRRFPDVAVTVLDALTYAGSQRNLDPVSDRIAFVHGDICDAALIDGLVQHTDVVVHFAAESHVDNSLNDPSPFVRTNILGTFTLLEAVRRYDKRLHHISTDEVFGDLPLDSVDQFTETTAYDPSSPYSASKASSDMLVRAWVRSYGVAGHALELRQQLRPVPARREADPAPDHQRPARRQAQAVRRRRQRPRMDPRRRPQRRGPPHHRRRPHRRDLPDRLRRRTQQPADHREDPHPDGPARRRLRHVPDRPGHDLRYSNNTTKLRTELGWHPTYDFDTGLSATITWYRENPTWWKPPKHTTEAKYKLLGR